MDSSPVSNFPRAGISVISTAAQVVLLWAALQYEGEREDKVNNASSLLTSAVSTTSAWGESDCKVEVTKSHTPKPR